MRKRRQFITLKKHEEHKCCICIWYVSVLALLVLTGCSAPTLKEDPRIKVLSTGLNTIDTVQPEDLADSPPVSIVEATKEIT
jgi:hypothetical protein